MCVLKGDLKEEREGWWCRYVGQTVPRIWGSQGEKAQPFKRTEEFRMIESSGGERLKFGFRDMI